MYVCVYEEEKELNTELSCIKNSIIICLCVNLVRYKVLFENVWYAFVSQC